MESAVYNYLKNLTRDAKHHLRLFCDGCVGQNKNSNMIIFYLLNDSSPHLKNVTSFFGETSHFFPTRLPGFWRAVITSKYEYIL